jgi:cell division transport system permease protein
LLKEPGSSLLTWAVIGIALSLPLCLLLVLLNFRQFSSGLDEAGNISLYMNLGLDDQALASVTDNVNTLASVAATRLISASQALGEFETLSGFGDILEDLDENPLPAVIEVTPVSQDPDSIRLLSRELESFSGVDTVQVDLEWVRRLDSMLDLAQRFTLGLALLLCLGVVLAVGNTVRLAIENRRDEILVVKLVGGTDAYVSRPFLYTGLWFGVGGGLIALVLVLLTLLLLSGPVGRLVTLYDSDFSLVGLSISEVLLILVVAGGLGLAGAWLSVLRHLRQIEPV